MLASNQNNTLCMHVITDIAAALSIKIYIHLESANMAPKKPTLVNLGEEKQFQFTYTKKINGLKLIRKGSKHEAIVSKVVQERIQSFSQYLIESNMERKTDGKKVEKEKKVDFLYFSEDITVILPYFGNNISYFAGLKAVYFCRHLRNYHMDYRWLAVTFFLKKYPMYRNNE